MRRPAFAILILAGLGTGAWSGDERSGPAEPPLKGDSLDRRSLGSTEIDRYVSVYLPAIKACYLKNSGKTATGELRLELIIHRDGNVVKVAVTAPGVVGAPLRKLDACVKSEVARWHFPVRAGYTSAIVPYFFLRSNAAGAGPQYSCWSPRGCPGQGDSSRPARGGKP
jgi:hypothetical protein